MFFFVLLFEFLLVSMLMVLGFSGILRVVFFVVFMIVFLILFR